MHNEFRIATKPIKPIVNKPDPAPKAIDGVFRPYGDKGRMPNPVDPEGREAKKISPSAPLKTTPPRVNKDIKTTSVPVTIGSLIDKLPKPERTPGGVETPEGYERVIVGNTLLFFKIPEEEKICQIEKPRIKRLYLLGTKIANAYQMVSLRAKLALGGLRYFISTVKTTKKQKKK